MEMSILTDGLLFPEGPTVLPDGDVVVVEIHRGTLTRVRPDGSKTIVANVGGGPNGSALGPDGRVYIANCGGLQRFEVDGYAIAGGIAQDYETGSIQAVDLSDGSVETLYTEGGGSQLRGPNDLVVDAHGGIYFTDYGKSDGVTGDKGRLFYAAADGSSIEQIAGGMEGPNGIGLSPDGTRLYVSETMTARVWWWDVMAPGKIQGGKSLGGSGGGNFLYTVSDFSNFDSLGVDGEGNVCVACLVTHGIAVVTPDGDLKQFVDVDFDGDPGITNITWGGDDMRTAYVTASCLGRLIKIENWPRPGLVLNYGAGPTV